MGGGFDQRQGAGDRTPRGPDNARPLGPGKRTLTEQFAPVQRSASSAPADTDHSERTAVQLAAVHGVTGTGAPLPHRETIQRLFGQHDISGIKAHVGGEAATASRAIGAEAYATGDHVAFADEPSLHTAAHEAAHAVQQRGGVQLKGGVGAEGDAYERHADEVADAVVTGRSAERLLDRHAGGDSGSPTVQRKPKAKPMTVSTMVFTVDGSGLLSNDHGETVGFRGSDGKSYVAVDAKSKKGVPLTAAHLGTIRIGAELVIERVEEVTLAPVPEVDAVSGGTLPDPKQIASQRVATFNGKVLGVIDGDGSQILKHGATWDPIPPSALASTLAGKLNEQVRIDLDDGRSWVWMSYALSDERAETARWVPPAHARKEVSDRATTIDAQARKLPSGSDVKAAVDQVIKTISVISTVEGDFDSQSTSEDDHASLGIFQWAMEKSSSADAGSLGKFFRTLKARATESAKKAEKDRSEEDKLYIAAWKQCTDHGLDVNARQILIGGKPATGAQIENAMSDEMGKGSLRTYQLIAAKDWIDEFRATVVRPGPSAATSVGHSYTETNADGTAVTLTSGRDMIKIEADGPATVGSLFASEKAIANAIMLGVNRPHYVEGALWRAMSIGTDTRKAVDDRLTALMSALAPAEPAPAAGVKRPRRPASHHYTVTDVAAAGADAVRLYGELQAILWPNRQLDAAAQQQLEVDFKKQALKLYQPSDARRYHRERRFSTVDSSW